MPLAAWVLLSLVIPATGAETLSVVDAAGRTVAVPRDARRIVGLGPGCLRLLVYLGATDRVVGVERFESTMEKSRPYRLAHPELTNLPVIGPGGPKSINQEPDLEAVLTAAPHIIFVSSMEAPVAQAMQEKLGIPVVVLSYGKFARYDPRVFDSLELAGRILGVEERATSVRRFMEEAEADVRARAAKGQALPGYEKPKVYVGGTGLRGTHGLTSTDHPYAPLEWLSADNLASRITDDGHTFIDKEKLLSLDPDILFLDGSGLAVMLDDFRQNPEYAATLRPIREGRTFVLFPFTSYLTNLDTIVADSYAAGKILYPEAFADTDPAAKADVVYAFLDGKPVYTDMAKEFGALGQPPAFLRNQ
jgi:iron complex transport system substrate-binding protein